MNRSNPSLRHFALAALLIAATQTPAAVADVGLGPPIGLSYGTSPVLSATLHPAVSSDAAAVAFTARGSFRIGTKHLGSIPKVTGVATTVKHAITMHIGTYTRLQITSYAHRHHARKVLLITTINYRTGSYSQQTYLRVPR